MEKEFTQIMQKEFGQILQKLLDNIPIGSAKMKYDGTGVKITFANKALFEFLGCTREEFATKYDNYYNRIMFPEDWQRMKDKIEQNCIAKHTGFEMEYHVCDGKGAKSWRFVRVVPVQVFGDDCLQFAISDTTVVKETEQQLDSLIRNFPGCIICVSYGKDHATLKYVSEGVKELTGYTQEEYRRYFANNADKIYSEDNGIERRAFLDAAKQDGKGIRKEYLINKRDGSKCWIEARSSVVSNTGRHIVVQYAMLDITEQKLAQEIAEKERMEREEKLRIQMELDSMTGLYNGQTVRKRIAEKLANSVCNEAYVIVGDIDEFKGINDTMGHLFGDAVLSNFANVLKEMFTTGTIGRIAGDDFLFYLEGVSEDEILKRIEKVNKRLARIHVGNSDDMVVSASFGLARCNKGKKNSLEKLEKQADTALILLREDKKGIARIYTEDMAELHVERVKKRISQDAPEAIIQTEGDLLLFAHELFDNVKDIRGVVQIISDNITRFYMFQDILYVRRESGSSFKLAYHWGENNVRQFYGDSNPIVLEKDWKRLLYSDKSKECVVLLEEDFVGENVNQAKSMLSFRICDEKNDGYFICVDRKNKRSWKEELPALLRLGEYIIRRYYQIEAKQKAEEAAEYKAKYDWVTGLPNYSYFLSICHQYVKEHEDQKFAIIYTDFLNFKFLNEVYGYAEGDKLLQEFAKMISEEDAGLFHGRINADRFVSLCELHDMEKLVERFLKDGNAFCQRVNDRYVQCNIALVGGIAEVDRSLDSIAMNVDNANVARKNAKQESKVQALVYSPALREELQKQMEIEANMVSALKAGEFKVFLQPKMDMFTDKIIGAEALVRWFKPDGTIVSPGEFIPIFEKNGFVIQIDFEILRQVLDVQQKRLNEGKPIVKISVNFSRRHQESPSFIHRLDELLAQYEVPTKSLEIEITESMFMRDLEPLTENIRKLKERGLSVSIDDFGAGYSSLNVLSRIKADIVKLDRQFLLDVEMEKDNFTSDFLQLLVNMINQLGLEVLAEGVETKQQVELLKNAGCRFAQGFYYAKPMPVDEFIEFLDSHAIGTEE